MPHRYEKTSAPVLRAANDLYDALDADLDLEGGGSALFRDALDTRRNCLITDYTLASIRGVQRAIIASAYEVENFAESQYASNAATTSRVRSAEKAGGSPVAAIAGDQREQETAQSAVS